MGLPNPSRETKFSGPNADREISLFPIQLTTCRTGNLTRLIYTLAICVTIHEAGDISLGCTLSTHKHAHIHNVYYGGLVEVG